MSNKKALAGIRVIDLTTAYSGPFATMQLADFGAEVIKIENNKYGDGSRTWSPTVEGNSIYFLNMNRNKKSITLNLKSEEGKKIVLNLVRDADVVVENFRPGVMARMGLTYEALKEVNPRIIMASLSGYGQTGPYAKRAAYSNLAEALSGLMYVTGFPDGKPTGSGVALGDSIGGLFLAQGILTALFHRERTGEGQYIDVSMTDSLVSMLAIGMIQYDVLGKEQERIGNRDPAAFPYDLFEAKDGYCILSVATVSDWTPFAKVCGLEHLLEDPRFLTNDDRVKNADELYPYINEFSKQHTRAELAELFESAGQGYSDVLKPSEVMQNEQILARDMVVEVEAPFFGKYKMQGIPVKMSETPGSIDLPIPALGEHNAEILERLGYNPADLERLKAEGVI